MSGFSRVRVGSMFTMVLGVAVILAGVSLVAPYWRSTDNVHDAYLALSGDDLVVAYHLYGPAPAIYVTKLDASLVPVFRDVQVTPPGFTYYRYPASPYLKVDANDTIHVLWTLYGSGSGCQYLARYSRISGDGVPLVIDRPVGEGCLHSGVNWDLDAEGFPVVMDGFPDWGERPNPFEDLGCYTSCLPIARRTLDGVWLAVTTVKREEWKGRSQELFTHVALYTQNPSTGGPQRIAVLASDDPWNPVDLQQEMTAPSLVVLGLGLTASGIVVFLLVRTGSRGRRRDGTPRTPRRGSGRTHEPPLEHSVEGQRDGKASKP